MATGFAVFAGTKPENIHAAAREAERLGFASFWVNHPGATDGLAALAQAAGQTRRIELGIGVIPLHTRGPESIVGGVKTTALPLDRLLLGVGSPNPDSLKRVRAGIAELRSNLSTRLIVAALGPQMCRLAGEGAAAARRQPPKLYAYLRVALGPTARDLLEQEANRYAGVPAYAANFTRMGLKPGETAIAAQNRDDVQRGLAPWSGVVDHIIVRSITAKDTVDEHVALVKAAAPA
jgi:Luciferase-like monooxygenase